MPQKRDITKYLFWIVVFLWLIYGTLIVVFIGGDQDWATGRYREQLDVLKGDRDDAFKQGSGVKRDWWGEITEADVSVEDMVRHTDTRERQETESFRDVMDRNPDRYNTLVQYLTDRPIEVFGFLTVLGFILSVFFGWVDSRHKRLKVLRRRK